jgi:hypothetical protein
MLKQPRVLITLFVIFALFFHIEAKAMFSFGMKLHLFSAVEGTVLNGKEPVANAILKRTYEWRGESVSDEQITDENGNFSFPDAHQRSLWGVVPHNPSISQEIKILVEDKEYQAWGYVKGNYDINGELLGQPMRLLCDITSPEQTKKANNIKNYVGICEIDPPIKD